MKINHFELLELKEKLAFVKHFGVFLAQRNYYNLIIKLFQVDAYYVEVFTFKDDGKVLLIQTFNNTEELDPYLSEIDITALAFL
ncbi:MAG: hypothetical protein NVS9B7_20800 [Flavisolibacter sp.]